MGALIGSTFRDAAAAQFNGTDEYVYKDAPSFKAHTQGAISVWFRTPVTFVANTAYAIYRMGATDANSAIGVLIRRNSGYGTTQTRIEVSILGTTNRFYFGSTSISANTWYHVVWQSNGTTSDLYVNGVQQTLILRSATMGASSNTTNNGEWFGVVGGTSQRIAFGASYNNGAIAAYSNIMCNEAAYFSRALSGGEVTELYNSGATKNPHRLSFASVLQHWWRMGDSRDSATTIYDEIGSDNLTLVNMDASNYVTP